MWLLLAIAMGTNLLSAGSLAISPVRIELSKQHPTSVITVENQGQADCFCQVEAMAWAQINGEDQYESTRELIAVPPLFRVPPKGRQIVRVGIRWRPEPRELAFRLFIQEVPLEEGAGEAVLPGIRTLLRVGVPVFIAPAEPVSRIELRCTAERGARGLTAITIQNPTAVHIQIGRVQLAQEESMAAALYVLPRQWRRWVLPKPVAISEDRFEVRLETDRGTVTSEVSVEP